MLHHPKSRGDWLALRLPFVTSTESPALFDESPYITELELWYNKRDNVVEELEPNERMTWGTRLQDAIARGIADDYGVKVRKLTAFCTHDKCRMGASFDFEIIGLSETSRGSLMRDLYEKHGPGILEVKNVDSLAHRDNWTKEEAPSHIEIQLQHQMETIDRNWGAIGALVGGNRPEVIIRTRDHEVGAGLRAAVDGFWASVASGVPPSPNFARDIETIRKVYGFAEPGKLFDARGNERVRSLCQAYANATAQQGALKDIKEAAAAELLTLIGPSEKVITDGYSVSAAMRAGYRVEAYDVQPRRDFRVFEKKAKAPKERAA